MLTVDSITFGKYKGKTLSSLLRDRTYCKWLVGEEWFQTNYPYLHTQVREYNPSAFFIAETKSDDFPLVLREPDSVEHPFMSPTDKVCYTHYFKVIEELKAQIKTRLDKNEPNIYNIKTPTKWLQKFEKDTGLSRDSLKRFLAENDLPNITWIVEKVKALGGIVYNGNNSYKIASKNSKAQEAYWEELLKTKYGEQISCQFKLGDCIFDFLNISAGVVYECKLGLKDFNGDQFRRYTSSLSTYRLVYLISTDCIINLQTKEILTTNPMEYILYLGNLPLKSTPTEFDAMIEDFDVVHVSSLDSVL